MPTFPNDDDGAVLKQLAAHGADLSKPMVLEFAIHAPDEKSAMAIQKAVAARGYSAKVDYDEGEPDEEGEIDPDDEEFGPAWTVYVESRMVPAHADIVRIQKELDELSQPHGGFSDGWGAML